MATVLLTADAAFSGSRSWHTNRRGRRRERGILADNNRWAGQVDVSDSVRRGGAFQQVRIRVGGSLHSAQAVLNATVAGYRRAVARAGPTGTIAVLVGHADGGAGPGGGAAFIDLAPVHALRVVENDVQAAAGGATTMPARLMALQAIRDAVAGRVAALDFLSCNVGHAGGPALLDRLQRYLRNHTSTPSVRGLRGYLQSIEENRRVVMWVTSQRGGPRPARVYRDRIPPGPWGYPNRFGGLR